MLNVESNQQPATSRAIHLVLVATIGLAVVGFFIGIGQERPVPSYVPTQGDQPGASADALPATSYAEFDRRRLGPNRQWRSVLSDLDDDGPPLPAAALSPFQHEESLTKRADRRAFDGSPPTIPHPIDQRSSAACRACHVAAQYIGKSVFAPAMSHEYMANCTQCHIEQESLDFRPFLLAENTFEGAIRPQRGSRTWSAAPPTVPHSLVMREKCLSCHGPSGAHAIRTEHPWDAVCLQCHIPAVIHDQFARPETLRRLGILETLLNELTVNENADIPSP